MPRDRRLLAAGAALLLLTSGVVATLSMSRAESSAFPGAAVSPEVYRALVDAAQACPALSPPRLAGQIMEASGFGTIAVRPGREGIAGLDDTVWKRWAPWSDAKRSDAQASIAGLAHHMCDLVGQIRAAGISVADPWRLALAAHNSSAAAVVQAGDVPASVAGYVDLVAGYTAWYALQPQFGGPGLSPEESAGLSTPLGRVATQTGSLPDNLVPLVVQAGQTCPEFPPPLVAAQLMAMSGFKADYQGPSGSQGIAMFLPQIWSRYAPSPSSSPLDSAAAIPAFARAMCDLIAQMRPLATDPYAFALAAYLWGADASTPRQSAPRIIPVADFIRQVLIGAELFAHDARLSATATSGPTPSASASSASHPAPAPVTRTNPPTSSTPSSPPSPAPTVSTRTATIVSADSGKCLTATAADTGTKLTIWQCTGSPGQQWTVGADGTLRVLGLCMDTAGGSTAKLTPVQISPCNGSPSQKWRINLTEDLVLQNMVCADVYSAQTADGSKVILWPCTGCPNQTWYFR